MIAALDRAIELSPGERSALVVYHCRMWYAQAGREECVWTIRDSGERATEFECTTHDLRILAADPAPRGGA